MAIPNSPIYKNKMRGAVYLLNFIFALQSATVGYFGANYLSYLGLPERYIAFVFALVSLCAMLSFFVSSRLFNRFGAYKVVFISSVFYLFTYLAQAYLRDIRVIIPVFVLGAAPAALLVAALDSLMERFTGKEEETGSQRGMFITLASAAFVVGPFLGGLLVKGNDFKSLWLAGSAFLLALMTVLFWKFKSVEKIKYKEFHVVKTLRAIARHKNILNIFMAQFVLYFFYSIMVIYTSVYLKNVLAIPYDRIGFIFAFMLLPFAFMTVPLGKLADTKYGEKEMLLAGLIVTAIFTALFALMPYHSVFVIAGLLFGTRVGASMVQTMTETYFFKQVDGKDTDLISAFRAMYPLASIIAPLMASPILFFASFKELFLFLSVIVFSGVFFALRIKDTL